MQLRKDYREAFEKKHGVKLGFMGFFVKSAVQALKEIPAVNAEIDGQDLVYKNYYHVGVAVGKRHGFHRLGPEAVTGQSWSEPRGQMPNRLDRSWIRIDAADVVSRTQQIDQVPSVPATRIEYPHTRTDPAPLELIEQINVNAAKLRGEAGHLGASRPKSPGAAWGRRQGPWK